ncbi:MAG: hypothetical protein WDN66_02285 [Candidatus Saccharibacteria bacterium]
MSTTGHFELARNRQSGLASEMVPVYVNESGEQLEESTAILEAIAVIESTLGKEGFMDLGEIVDHVGELLTAKQKKEGLLIEDEDTRSTVKITKSKTSITVRGKGTQVLPSGLMFDALYLWKESLKKPTKKK